MSNKFSQYGSRGARSALSVVFLLFFVIIAVIVLKPSFALQVIDRVSFDNGASIREPISSPHKQGGSTTATTTTTTTKTSGKTTPPGKTTQATTTTTTPSPTPTPTSTPTQALPLMQTGDINKNITVSGQNRTYTEYVPTIVNTNTNPINVLLVLHGTGGTGAVMRPVGFDSYADTGEFITVYPDALLVDGIPKWDPATDVAFLQTVVNETKQQLGARAGKFYVAGMSNGSMMTQVTGCAIPDIVGIAPVSGSINDFIIKQCKPTHPLRYIGFYGTEDHFAEIDKYETSVAFFSSVNGCTANYSPTQLPDVDPTDGTTVELRTYLNTSGGACSTPVLYYRITGGGHFWPGATQYTEAQITRNTGSISFDINATKLIVNFFGLDK